MARKYRIDIARFECPTCGHWSTPPEAINVIPHEMELYNIIDGSDVPDKDTENILVQTLNQYHYGNDFTINPILKTGAETPPLLNPDVDPSAYEKVISVNRSYCEVQYQSSTILDESDHITLGCPQCHALLYEVRWK